MARFQIKTYTEILLPMVARFLARTGLTDIGDASVAKHQLANTARTIDRAYIDMGQVRDEYDLRKCRGDALDQRAKDFVGIGETDSTREKAIRAYGGSVVFWRLGTTGTVVIPAGTVVKTASGVSFSTIAQAQIDASSASQIAGHAVGRDAPPVSVIAVAPGKAGNVAIGAIVGFASRPAGVDGVANLAPTSYGADRESDDSFIGRIEAALQKIGRTGRRTLVAAALGVKLATGQRVRSAVTIDDFDIQGRTALYIDDGAGTAESTATVTNEDVTNGLLGPPPNTAVGGEEHLRLDFWPIKTEAGITITSSTRGALTVGTTVKVSPTDGWLKFEPALVTGEGITASYTRFTGLIQEVQKVIDGDDAAPTTYQGYAAQGGEVRVLAPTVRWQRFEAVVTVLEGFDKAAVVAAAVDRVARYYNTLPIGADVVRAALIALIGPQTLAGTGLAGVGDLLVPWPIDNQAVGDDEVARILSSQIAIT